MDSNSSESEKVAKKQPRLHLPVQSQHSTLTSEPCSDIIVFFEQRGFCFVKAKTLKPSEIIFLYHRGYGKLQVM